MALAAMLLGLFATGAFAANPVVVLETSEGSVMVLLEEDKAPVTVANFLKYVDSGFYNGTIFHRVIDGFMVQGGGFDMTMMQKPAGNPIMNEANNGLDNKRGTIAMARTSDPQSASCQFFINHADNAFLDYKSKTEQGWGYAVFGRVIRGMDVVDKIAKVKTGRQGGMGDVPLVPVVIKKAYRHQS
ncbi:MAG: peptidyl-prolyl cis-trans isomerase [Proteobacteria bacterium]|nr:peptidyl-prolyl cis-trans isomerase [Pseudomonadota bacterium]